MNFAKNAAVTAAALVITMLFGARVSAQVSEHLYEAKNYGSTEREISGIVLDAVRNRRTDNVDISGYNISFSEFEDIYTTTLLNEPEFFDVSVINVNVRYRNEDHVLDFSPVYNDIDRFGGEKKISAYADRIMSGIKSEWSDEEKILYIHDSLASDITYYKGKVLEHGRSIYDAMIKKSAVCVGYAMSFQYFMDKLGIPCINVNSKDHIWNMVMIGGKWYHVDLTWDDSYNITKDLVRHNMLLVSDWELYKTDKTHDTPKFSKPATDTSFDKAFWRKTDSPVCYNNGYWYYTTREGLYRHKQGGSKDTRLYKGIGSWTLKESGKTFSVCFSQPVAYKDSIYFNTPYAIYRYDTVNNKVVKTASPSGLSGNTQIFDMYLSGRKLVFCCGTSDDLKKSSMSKRSIKLSA